MLCQQVPDRCLPDKTKRPFAPSDMPGSLPVVARLVLVFVSLCTLSNAQPASVFAQKNDVQWSLEKARRAVLELAKTETKNEFATGYMLLLAKHHVVPMIAKGRVVTVGAGATMEFRNATHFLLRSVDGVTDDPGRFGFVRGVTRDGRWTKVDKQPVENLCAMVVKTRDMLFVIDLAANTICPMVLKEIR